MVLWLVKLCSLPRYVWGRVADHRCVCGVCVGYGGMVVVKCITKLEDYPGIIWYLASGTMSPSPDGDH